jgi:hypothetical protein
MATKKARDPKYPARVWIELEKPVDEADGHRMAELANNMLKRLAKKGQEVTTEFWWNEERGRYDYGSPMGCYSLADWGEWFNLEYMGRPIDE